MCLKSTKNFVFKIREMVEKIKMDADELPLVSKSKKVQL